MITKRFYLCTLLAAVLFVCSCSDGRSRLRGNIRGLDDGKVFLVGHGSGGVWALDSATVRGGRFSMRLPDIVPDILYLRLGERCEIPLVVTGEELRVEGNLLYRELPAVYGSHENGLLTEYRRMIEPARIQEEALERQLAPYRDSTSLGDSASYSVLLRGRYAVRKKMGEIRSTFIADHPLSIVAAMIAAGEPSSDAAGADSLIRSLDVGNMADNVFLRRLKARRDSLARL